MQLCTAVFLPPIKNENLSQTACRKHSDRDQLQLMQFTFDIQCWRVVTDQEIVREKHNSSRSGESQGILF